jgi:hypothetical protein
MAGPFAMYQFWLGTGVSSTFSVSGAPKSAISFSGNWMTISNQGYSFGFSLTQTEVGNPSNSSTIKCHVISQNQTQNRPQTPAGSSSNNLNDQVFDNVPKIENVP